MRILFVIDSMPCHRFLKEAQALSARGIELFMCYRAHGSIIARDADLSIFRKNLRLKKRELFAGNKIAKFAIANNIEIIHFHNYPDKLCYQIMKTRLKIPIIFDQHDLMSLQRTKFSKKKKYWEKYCLEHADGYVFVTDFYQRSTFDLYDLAAPYVILPNMISQEATGENSTDIKKLSDIDGNVHLVWIGLITKNKDHHRYMVKTFEILSDKGFIIHIYPTRTKEYPHYSEIRNLHIHQQLSYKEMMKAIAVYDAGLAFFNPWMTDERKSHLIKHAFPNKINDYIFAGVPPITLNSYFPMAEYIKKYDTGYIYREVDDITPDSIREKLEIYQNNISLNRKQIIADIDQQLDKLIDIYKLLKGRSNEET